MGSLRDFTLFNLSTDLMPISHNCNFLSCLSQGYTVVCTRSQPWAFGMEANECLGQEGKAAERFRACTGTSYSASIQASLACPWGATQA